ncbi:MAG TPA: chromate transporter [Bacteroidota bacterium]|nr:chromate transporter [Bacteroidota bacterium]
MNFAALTEKAPAATDGLRQYTLKDLCLYFLRLGTTGFGGPVALVGYMERDLVESKRWFERDQFFRGLALAQLAPGPLAAQLAIYLGYLKGRIKGATLAGIAFVMPSFVMVTTLGMLYVRYGGLAWMQALFYGIGAGIVGIIVRSAVKLSIATLKHQTLLWALFILSCAFTAWTKSENPWLILSAGVIAMLIYAPPSQLRLNHAIVSTATLFQALHPSEPGGLTQLFLFFVKAGAFVFGSGLAIVPFLYGGVVHEHRWLTERQFLDAVAVAMITPGPVVITVGFIGYLVGGFPGACIACLGVFLPVYLFVVLPAPYVERYASNAHLRAFVSGITAAAIGALAGAVVVLGQRTIADLPTLLIAAAALLLLVKFKIPEPVIVLLAAVTGLLLYLQ